VSCPSLSVITASSCVLAAALCVTTPVQGGRAVYLRPRDSEPGRDLDVTRRAQAALQREIALPGLTGLDLAPVAVLRAAGGITVRFSQRLRGLQVLGSSAAVRLDGRGAPELLMLDVARAVDVNTRARWSAAEACASLGLGRECLLPRRPELAVLPAPGRSARLVWVVDVPSGRHARRYLVDAHDGALVGERPLGFDAVLGRVYPVSQTVTPESSDLVLLQVNPATPLKLTGWSGQMAVANFVAYGARPGDVFLAQVVEPSSGDDFLYDPPQDPMDRVDPFAQVNGYYHLSRAREFFTSALGVDMSGAKWKLVAAVNVLEQGAPFDGAYFSPAGVSAPWNAPNFLGVGQGATVDFAYDSDVFLHEFTHYVSYNAVGFNAGPFAVDDWGWSPFSIAIDEGVADYFACTMNDGPVVGEATLVPLGKGRDLSDASKRCPDDVVGEGHLDGAIIGSFAWSLREAFGKDLADQVVWGAVTMLPHAATFEDFVLGVRLMVDDLVNSQVLRATDRGVLDALLRSRGLDECGREIPLYDAQTRTMRVAGLDLLGAGIGATCDQIKSAIGSIPGIFQFVVKPGASSGGLRIHVSLEPFAPGDLDWSLYLRAGEHVQFEPGSPLPVPSVYDRELAAITTSDADLTVESTSQPPFDPSQTYHLALTHRNCPSVTARITAYDVWPAAGWDAGDGDDGGAARPGDDGERGAGCGCRAAVGAETGGWMRLSAATLLGVAGSRIRRKGGAKRKWRG